MKVKKQGFFFVVAFASQEKGTSRIPFNNMCTCAVDGP